MTKVMQNNFHPILIIGIAAAVGASTAYSSSIALMLGVGFLVVGILRILYSKNANGDAHLFASLMVGSEVYFRMSFTELPWEFGKISVIILLLVGMVVQKRQCTSPTIYLLYGFLLIPAFFITDFLTVDAFKKGLMFNILGHICLIVAVFYFFKRKMSIDEWVKLSQWLIYGVVLMSALLIIKVPDYETIRYGGGSNFEASGGFGPNQVAAILGVGMFVMGYFLLINQRLFGFKIVDFGLLAFFTLQGFFTLSRGGLMTAGLALLTGIIVLYIFNFHRVSKYLKLNFFKIGSVSLIILSIFSLTDQIADGAVSKRYFNVDESGRQIKQDYSTNRLGIIEADMETFKNNVFTGAGIGGARNNRFLYTGISAVHVEFTRMLAEHGFMGLIAVLIMFCYPIRIFFKTEDTSTRFILVIFVMFGLVTMSHNAMRLALPGYFYGLGFIVLYTRMIRKPIARIRR